MHAPLGILMLSIEYPPVGGGASPVTRGLARALVHVPSVRARRERSRVHELAAYAIGATSRARVLAAQCRYDVCHAHFILPTGWVPYPLRRRRGFPPYAITALGTDVPGHNPHRFTLLHRISPLIIRPILRLAAGVIVLSDELEQLVRAAPR